MSAQHCVELIVQLFHLPAIDHLQVLPFNQMPYQPSFQKMSDRHGTRWTNRHGMQAVSFRSGGKSNLLAQKSISELGQFLDVLVDTRLAER